MIDRLLADHQAEPREVAADHVVERLVAGMALDVLEQQRRAFFQADEIGDVRGFEIGADLGGDALEFAHRLGLLQPDVELAGVAPVGRPMPFSAARRWWRCPPAFTDMSMARSECFY